jgi:hypothetical protein
MGKNVPVPPYNHPPLRLPMQYLHLNGTEPKGILFNPKDIGNLNGK